MKKRDCRHHGAERWVTCVHTDLIRTARPVQTEIVGGAGGARVTWRVSGEAVCPGCLSGIEHGRPPSQNLRLACGSCVRERWPLEVESNVAPEFGAGAPA